MLKKTSSYLLASSLNLLLGFNLISNAQATDQTNNFNPEAASGFNQKPNWQFSSYAVAAANPLASLAGAQILAQGGNALDAAIAAQFVLSLVEPQSSGLGGGGFLMLYHQGELTAWDGRETAPANASPELFLTSQGKQMPFSEAVTSGLSVGVPGLIKMLEAAHQQSGKLDWEKLAQPAIKLAEEGFEVSPRLHQLLKEDKHLRNNPQAASFYYPNNQPLTVGSKLKNPAFAAILRKVAIEGSQAFYQGKIAQNLVTTVEKHQGLLSLNDLANYQAIARSALCSSWQPTLDKLAIEICGMPPPSSGHLTLMQLLNLYTLSQEEQPNSAAEFYTANQLHKYFSAANLAFADRALYIADPDFVPAPANDWQSLLAEDYLASRAELIGTTNLAPAKAGVPQAVLQAAATFAPMPNQPEAGTTHISVIDAEGNAVALTSSIEQAFGARILADGGTGLAGGILLNNQLTDFSLSPTDAKGTPIANRVEAGKRPRSSMTPTLVFISKLEDKSERQLLASLGSPGGAAIIHYVAKSLLANQLWQASPQAAADLPNFATFNGQEIILEADRFSSAVFKELTELGYQPLARPLTSGTQLLLLQQNKQQRIIEGGADSRREGWVSGE